MNEEYLKKYCELVIKAGVNLYKGQSLLIASGIKNADFALKLAETAYANGAKYVDIYFYSLTLSKHRINNNADPADLEYMPDFYKIRNYEITSGDYAFIKIDNLEEIDVLKNIDTDKFGMLAKAEQITGRPIANAISGSKICWCIVAAPGPVWASKVFNKPPDENLTNELWEKLALVLHLDKKDPVEEWKANGAKLIERSRILSEMKLDKLIFNGPGTDLEIGLNKNCVWIGGMVKAKNGRMFIPNIPTEEVFTTPDYRRVNGKVRVTKPVKVMENILTDISFEFKNGKVIQFDSKPDSKILEKYFSTDEGASYLGEVALVDKSSGVHKSGLIFNSILYDENAACHIALGRGIPMCLPNKDDLLTPDDMMKNGCNYSLVHTDFMIGSDEINVTGVDGEGKKTIIIKDGEFKI